MATDLCESQKAAQESWVWLHLAMWCTAACCCLTGETGLIVLCGGGIRRRSKAGQAYMEPQLALAFHTPVRCHIVADIQSLC